MADTNTKEKDLIPQEKEKDTQNEVSEPTVEQKATEYMTLQKVESMVPYKFIPVLIPKYGSMGPNQNHRLRTTLLDK